MDTPTPTPLAGEATDILIARLVEAREGTQELDRALVSALDLGRRYSADMRPLPPHPWTTSLDAALTLAREVLPEAYPDICRNVPSPRAPEVKEWTAELHFPLGPGAIADAEAATPALALCGAEAATPALALCAAILRALKDQQP